MEKRVIARRKFLRPISFDMVSDQGGQFENISCQGAGVDISEGGIGMITDRTLEKDKVIRLLLPVVGGKTRIPVFSVIKWAEVKGTYSRVGLQFLG